MGLKLAERIPARAFDEQELDETASVLARFWREAEQALAASRAPARIEPVEAPAASEARNVRYSYD